MSEQVAKPSRHHIWRITLRALSKSWDDSIFSEESLRRMYVANERLREYTLMLQQVLAHPDWRLKLEPRDLSALTPLIWEHVNSYGRFELDSSFPGKPHSN